MGRRMGAGRGSRASALTTVSLQVPPPARCAALAPTTAHRVRCVCACVRACVRAWAMCSKSKTVCSRRSFGLFGLGARWQGGIV